MTARAMPWKMVAGLIVGAVSPAAAQNIDDDSTIGAVGTTTFAAKLGDAAELARQLGDESWEVRDLAERALLAYPASCMAQAEALLTSGETLSAEHRQRLLNVCRYRFLVEPRAALGVRQGPMDERGVVIEVALANFDAARVLRSGDIILTMDDMPVRSYEELRAAIISHDPGDRVAIQVLRGTEVHKVEPRLGAFADLRERGSIEQNLMRLAWDWRMQRLGMEPDAAAWIENGLSPARWAAARDAAAAANPGASRRHGDDSAVEVSVGGESNGGAPPRGGRGTTRVVIHNAADGFRDPASPRAVQLALAQNQLDNIRSQINLLTSTVEAFERSLAEGKLGEQDRRQAQTQVASMRRSIESLRMLEQAAIADVERWSR